MAQTEAERNEYDHKVIYSDLFNRIKSANANVTKLSSDVTELSGKIGSTVSGKTLTIKDTSGTNSIEYSPSSPDNIVITLADSAFTGVASVGEGALTLKVAGGTESGDYSRMFGANSSDNIEFTVPKATSTTCGVIKPGTGLTVSDGVLSVKPKIYTGAEPESPETGDIWVKSTGATYSGLPTTNEGIYIYTGESISGEEGTFLIENVKYGNYYLQIAHDSTDSHITYTRVLKSDGTLVSANTDWALGSSAQSESKTIYTGTEINGETGTFIIEGTVVDNYILQKAYDVTNSAKQYVRILNADGTLVNSNTTWNLGYANWA